MFSPCSPGIVNITLDICKKPVKQHAHVLGTRDTRRGGAAAGKYAQIALAPERFLDSQTGLALLICRARDVARTTRHARHVTHDTITARARASVDIPGRGNLMLRYHTPNLRYRLVL